jgi:hypothetical protein
MVTINLAAAINKESVAKTGSGELKIYVFFDYEDQDSVRHSNFANSVVKSLLYNDKFIQDKPTDKDIRLWDVYVYITDIAKTKEVTTRVDYNKYNGCPLEAVAIMNDVYKSLLKDLKKTSKPSKKQ